MQHSLLGRSGILESAVRETDGSGSVGRYAVVYVIPVQTPQTAYAKVLETTKVSHRHIISAYQPTAILLCPTEENR